jgi:hypothetical protein
MSQSGPRLFCSNGGIDSLEPCSLHIVKLNVAAPLIHSTLPQRWVCGYPRSFAFLSSTLLSCSLTCYTLLRKVSNGEPLTEQWVQPYINSASSDSTRTSDFGNRLDIPRSTNETTYHLTLTDVRTGHYYNIVILVSTRDYEAAQLLTVSILS